MRLFLVRHAESTWNAEGRWQGQSDPPLSPRGRLQARSLAARFFGAALERALCSDLSRAAETAAALGATPEPEPRLREIDVGDWAGLPRAEVAERFPEQVRGLRAGEPVRIGGGESMEEFESRVDALVDELRARHAGERVLAVTHGGVVRALATRVLGVRGRASPLLGVSNTALSVVAERDGRLALEVYNDALHLEAAPRDAAGGLGAPEGATLALVAASAFEEPDRRVADTLLSWLGIAQMTAVGAARDTALAEQLLADPSTEDAATVARGLDPEAEGGFAIVAPPAEVGSVAAALTGVDAAGLAEPPHGSVAILRLSRRGAVLGGWGLDVTAAEGLPG
ncbi:MAG TPA: histidine phosphatase family protein [Sandaracinaceae bacterium LLY-WYZ-13_1]|nr:histidine phosphatase family protein [Sandaracinaceae bacterium LLY-WYZ-13_1]